VILIAVMVFLLLLIMGMPIGFAIGISSIFGFLFGSDIPTYVAVQRIFSGLDSFPLIACPFFILAGELMTKGGITARIVAFSKNLVGFIRGGLGIVDILASMIFAGISGSGAADASAIGSILIPQLIGNRYPRGLAAVIEATSGSIGVIIPPSMIMIIYGSLTGVSIGQLFLGGIIPGILIGLGLMVVTYLYAIKLGIARTSHFDWASLYQSFKEAFWALIAPIIIIGGILCGVFTATEAGVIAVLYALFIGFVVYKELTLKNLRKIIVDSSAITGMVMLIVGMASIYGYILAIEQVPYTLTGYLETLDVSPVMISAGVLVFMLIIGCFMETMAIMVVFVPIVFPLINQMGLGSVHFGTLFCISVVIGGLTPPVGILIFITMGIAKASLAETIKYIFPYLAVLIAVLFLGLLFPEIITFLPKLFFG